METLWNLVNEASGTLLGTFAIDSTTDFTRQAWVERKTGRAAASETVRLSRAMARASFSSKSGMGNAKTMKKLSTFAAVDEDESPTTTVPGVLSPLQVALFSRQTVKHDRRCLDKVAILNIDQQLLRFACWVRGARQESDDEHFEQNQVTLNRCWRLFMLGLLQTESSSRYLAMAALSRVVETVKQTLVDVHTGKVVLPNVVYHSNFVGY